MSDLSEPVSPAVEAVSDNNTQENAKCLVTGCTMAVDIVFRSSDGLLVGFHTSYLAANTRDFPVPDANLKVDENEAVPLPESRNILCLISQLIHPRRPPNVEEIPGQVVIHLAEAVEKYGVFSGMEVCRMRMKQLIDSNPLEVLLYAVRHDHFDLLEGAALAAVCQNIDVERAWKVLKYCQPAFIAWVRYRDKRLVVSQEVMESPKINVDHRGGKNPTCRGWEDYHQQVKKAAGGKYPITLEEFENVCSGIPAQCSQCYALWRYVVKVMFSKYCFKDFLDDGE